MNRDEQEDTTTYKVVVNHEEQYSIWPADRENPLGWRDVGKSGTQGRVPGIYQRSVDRYASAQLAEKDGRGWRFVQVRHDSS